jgi:molecular chaperone DnaK
MLRDQRKPKQKKTDGTLQLEIHYEPISPEPEQVIAGKIVSPEGFLGEVQLSSDSGDWESGWITLKKSAFSATISLGRDASRTFSIRVRDGQGDLKPCEPNKFTVRSGVRSAAPVVPYNYGVVLYGGNQVKWIVESGASIPATGVAPLVLAKTIVAGSPEERVIHFVEGHSLFPSDNLLVGSFAIQGTELKRTLNENTDVEVRIRVDESRLVSARLYVPLIDEYFDVKLKSLTDPPSAAVLEEKLLRAKADLDEIEDEVSEEDQNQILQVERDLELLEAHMSRVTEGEQGEADRIHKHVSDAYARIRPLREKYLPSARFNVLIEFIADADELCAEFNDSMGRARLADIKQDAEKAHRLDQPNIIEELFDRVAEIFWTHYGKTRACWEWQVQNMKNRAVFATDPLTYHELIRKAETALAEEDFKGVALSASRARELIPEVAQGRSEYHDAALR